MKSHRIECMLFKPIPGCKTESDYDGYQVDHNDGNKRNNNINNLDFVTQSENMKRAYALGLTGKNRKEKRKKAKSDGLDFGTELNSNTLL